MKAIDRLLWRFFKINLSNPDDRNAWYLVLELFWAAILGSVATFNAAYAIRLGADNLQVSLLSSIPALMAVLVSYPAGQFLQRRSRRMPWILGTLFAYRASFLLVAAAPWLHLFGIPPGLMAVLFIVLGSAPAHFFNVGWIAMLGEAIPENRRAAVFTARNIVNQGTVSIIVFLCGQWLSRMPFPGNYQSLYLIGFLASMVSMYYLFKLHVPDSPVAAVAEPRLDDKLPPASETSPRPRRISLRERAGAFALSAKKLRAELNDNPAFFRITRNTFLHGVGVWMAAPLYTLYFVRQLDASDAWLGLNGTIASIGTIAGFSLWRWLIARWGEPVSLKRTICLIGVYPVLVGLTPSLPLILGYGVLNGLISPGVNLSHFNILLKVTPADARPRFTAIYITIMNIGAFISPLVSVAIADQVGLAPMLVVSGLLSIVGSTSFWWAPVLAPKPEAPQLAEAGI
jgi:MFS family permease